MIFHLHDDIRATAELDNPPAYLADFTEELFRARRQGRHIIYAHPATLEALEKLDGLSSQTVQTIRKVKSRIRTKKTLFESSPIHTRIIPGSGQSRRMVEGNKMVIEIPAQSATDDYLFRETTLLVENQSDGEFYKIIAAAYNRATNPNSTIRSQLSIFPGGGSQTPRHYNILRNEKKLTFCVIDGDLEYEGASLGTNTAQPIFYSNLASPPILSDALILDCYSIENLIPPTLIRRAHNLPDAGIRWLDQLQDFSKTEFWPFLPLKRKKECSSFKGDNNHAIFWRRHKNSFSPSNANCIEWNGEGSCEKPCTVFTPLSDKTLDKVLEYVSEKEAKGRFQDIVELVGELPQPVAALWKAVSEGVTYWGCSGDRMVAA